MLRSIVVAAIASSLSLAFPAPALAGQAAPATDANVITAVDVSNSIMRHEEWLELEGLAKAIVDPAVLNAIEGGRYGRIGFAVFTWSSGGHFEILVPWTLIASIEDAKRVAVRLRGFRIARSSWQRLDNGSGARGKTPELRTDISGTIDFAAAQALAAPYAAQRSVINVCANGADNVAQDPRAARDRALAAGIVINGLVIGGSKGLADYFRERVQGGPGSFVTQLTKPEAVAAAMIDKLLHDLIAAPRRAITTAVPFT